MRSLKIVPLGNPPRSGCPTRIIWLDESQQEIKGSAVQRRDLSEARRYAKEVVRVYHDITEIVDLYENRVYTREEYLTL